eukprot:218839-Chlamydomonas_euryale.AAC.2
MSCSVSAATRAAAAAPRCASPAATATNDVRHSTALPRRSRDRSRLGPPALAAGRPTTRSSSAAPSAGTSAPGTPGTRLRSYSCRSAGTSPQPSATEHAPGVAPHSVSSDSAAAAASRAPRDSLVQPPPPSPGWPLPLPPPVMATRVSISGLCSSAASLVACTAPTPTAAHRMRATASAARGCRRASAALSCPSARPSCMSAESSRRAVSCRRAPAARAATALATLMPVSDGGGGASSCASAISAASSTSGALRPLVSACTRQLHTPSSCAVASAVSRWLGGSSHARLPSAPAARTCAATPSPPPSTGASDSWRM